MAAAVGLGGQMVKSDADIVYNALGFVVFVGPAAAAIALTICARAGRRDSLTRRGLLKIFVLTGIGFAVGVPGLIAGALVIAGLASGSATGALSAGAVSLFVLALGSALGSLVAVPTAIISALIALAGFSPSEPAATS